MKIINLKAENFKKISVVEITPDGNMVQIGGKNGSGKTSVLDAMWAALGGKDHVPAVAIRRGAKEAKIVLDLGEMIVTRHFQHDKDGREVTKDVRVENKDGFRPSSPQRMLDGLLGKLAFEPLAFLRASPKDQYEMLRRFVPDVDFDAIDKANKADFDKRRDFNRSAKDQRGGAESLDVPSGLPEDYVEEQELIAALATAGQHNGLIELRRERRATAERQIGEFRQIAADVRGSIPAALEAVAAAYDRTKADLQGEVADAERRLAMLKQRLTDCDTAREEAVKAERTSREGRAASHEREADVLRTQIDTAAPLPELIDVDAIQAQLADAKRINAGILVRHQRDEFVRKAQALEAQAQALTDAMEARTKARAAAIEKAALPVPGLGFGEQSITLDGLPFEQASDAQQLRVSVALAMAQNPKLRVIRIREGSLLDEDGMKILAQMADEHDCQVWIEVVDSTGKTGIVLEDGHIRETLV